MIFNIRFRMLFLLFASIFIVRSQTKLKPFTSESQNRTSEIGKLQIMAVNYAAYVEYHLGISESKIPQREHSNKYQYIQQLIVALSFIQAAICVYFIFKTIIENSKKTEATFNEKEFEKDPEFTSFTICLYHKDGIAPNFSKFLLLFHKDIEMFEILRLQGVLYLSLAQRRKLFRHNKTPIVSPKRLPRSSIAISYMREFDFESYGGYCI